MQIYQSLTPIHAPQGSAVALGYFDGVHCGHRAVLGAAVECARAGGLTAAAFTFELPASSTLKGGRILSLPQKHARVASLGIEEYQEAPFDEFRALTPEDFVQKVLVDCFNAKQLFCGDNFTFGARAAGNVERLRELCAPLGIGVHIVPMAQYGGQTVSSTRIRAALEGSSIRVDFVSEDPAVAAQADRIAVANEDAAAVESTAAAFADVLTDPSSQLLFLTSSRDTRYENYSVLRPLLDEQ